MQVNTAARALNARNIAQPSLNTRSTAHAQASPQTLEVKYSTNRRSASNQQRTSRSFRRSESSVSCALSDHTKASTQRHTAGGIGDSAPPRRLPDNTWAGRAGGLVWALTNCNTRQTLCAGSSCLAAQALVVNGVPELPPHLAQRVAAAVGDGAPQVAGGGPAIVAAGGPGGGRLWFQRGLRAVDPCRCPIVVRQGRCDKPFRIKRTASGCQAWAGLLRCCPPLSAPGVGAEDEQQGEGKGGEVKGRSGQLQSGQVGRQQPVLQAHRGGRDLNFFSQKISSPSKFLLTANFWKSSGRAGPRAQY